MSPRRPYSRHTIFFSVFYLSKTNNTLALPVVKDINCDVAMKGKHARLADLIIRLPGLLFQAGHIWFSVGFSRMRASISGI